MLGILIAVFIVLSPLSSTLALAGDLEGSVDRFGGEIGEQDPVVQSVAGKTFFGTFVTTCEEIATSCMDFNKDGTITWNQSFGGNLEVFYGSYMEFKQGPNTFWGAVLRDQSDNGVFVLSGLSDVKSTFLFLGNIDVFCTPDGLPVTAIGAFTLSDCTPSGSEDGIGGTSPIP
jgi:hypothetical protein